MTSYEDGLDHLVNDDEMVRALRLGRFRALCRTLVIPAPMTHPSLPPCPGCVAEQRRQLHVERLLRTLGQSLSAHSVARHCSPGFVRKLADVAHHVLASSSPVGRHAMQGEQAVPAAVVDRKDSTRLRNES
ncbi:hypothetical protein [Amycolatopsis sp. La24]|uniref:hypothetical protein n=1 Tax=Amycolatopsis sp. La24 TaxID=3028304 RepID=UPI0023B036B4|nr:hypothetical protein [Amycolatopsis sp. La24]